MANETVRYLENEIQNETWKNVNVNGFESLYQVSSLGRVRRISDCRKYKTGRLLKARPSRDGKYLQYALCKGGIQQSWRAHRLVLVTFIGMPPSDEHVCAHNNGNHHDNRLENLRWATPLENVHDRFLHGTAIWNVDVMREVAKLRRQGMTAAQIAEAKNLNLSTTQKFFKGQVNTLFRFV